MSKRRTHSSIDKLPAAFREILTRMIVDNEWPDDFPIGTDADLNGKPRYEDLVAYCKASLFNVSLSSVGRWALRIRTLARMKQAGLITREIMSDLNAEKASATQKAVAEMITAVAIEFITSTESMDANELKNVARAMKDCTAIAINADKYVRDQIEKKSQAAAVNTQAKLQKAGVDRKLIQEIIDEHLGITKS